MTRRRKEFNHWYSAVLHGWTQHIQRLVCTQKSRAKKLGVVNTLTYCEWIEILAAHDYHCAYCHAHLSPNRLQIEHVIPLSRGGANSKENVIPACQHCNSKKHDKFVSEVSFDECAPERRNVDLIEAMRPRPSGYRVRSINSSRLNRKLPRLPS